MKVLFLDHDGVICLPNNFGSRFGKNPGNINEMDLPVEKRFDNFDKKAIKTLNKIIEKTDCEIVVSSDWKHWATIEEMGEYYTQQGIIKKPIDYTPFIDNIIIPIDFKWDKDLLLEQERAFEIKNWISNNNVDKWVAVDDMNLGKHIDKDSKDWGLDCFVHCRRENEGIKQVGINDKIIKFLL